MRIVIDLQGAQSVSRFRGIGRYSLSLALAMARNAGRHEIWLALNGAFPESILNIRHAFDGLIPPERIRIFEVPAPVAEFEPANAWRVCAAKIIHEHFLQQLNPDVVHVSSIFEGYKDNAVTPDGAFASGLCTAVTLYDLIPLLNQPDYLTDDTHRDYYLRKVQSLKKADLLLAISEASRREAIGALQLPPNWVVNISAAADERFRPLVLTAERIHQLQSRYGIGRKMVMYAPGGFDWRKNFEGLISAYAMLSSALRADHQLVIVGNIDADRRGYLRKLAKKAGLAKDELVITGYMPDEELVEFYNLATLFVFPSKHEGFGLPALEAMACGSPVIGSNCTSIPEVIGLPDALFDPYSQQDIAEKMAQALCDKSFREMLIVHGLNRAKNFTWNASARRVIDALEMLAQNKKTTLTSNGRLETIPELIRSIAEINEVYKPTDFDLIRVADCLAFNAGRAAPKQLLLDISVFVHGDAKSGIQRVVRSLLREFIENPPQNIDVRPIYFVGARYKYANVFTAVFTGAPPQNLTDEIVEFCQDDVYLALDLNAHLTGAVHDLHMRLQSLGVQLYFVVYDILFAKSPDWFAADRPVVFGRWLTSAAQVATGLICISEAAADEVRAWLKQNPPSRSAEPMVGSFHLGADIKNSLPTKGMPDNAAAVLNSLKSRLSFLTVGTVEPRKSHAQILAAFERLWAEGIDVNWVIVGNQGWKVEALADKVRRHTELGKRLFWFEGISDEYLEALYQTSACLIFASEGEGFGLPLIEAAQHKLPIIARDIPVFREVAGEYAFFFNGLEPQTLSDAIKQWLELNSQGKAPQSTSMPWLTWRQSAEQLLQQIKLAPGVCRNSKQQRQLFVDVSELVQRDAKSGVQRVTRSILSELLTDPADGFQTEPIYATVYQGYRYARRFTARFLGCPESSFIDSPIEFRAGDIFLGLDLQHDVVTAQQDFFRMLRRHGVKVYFLVYDLLPITLPKVFPEGMYEGHWKWLEVVAQNDGAICISKATDDDLRVWLNDRGFARQDEFRISWFHIGADIKNSKPTTGLPEDAAEVLSALTRQPSFLMVGTIEPRKGHSQTLAAFELLWERGIDANLVVVGKRGWLVNQLVEKLERHPELNRSLFWLEGISDEYLEKIYAASACLIAASEGEGFGLPLIEAAQHKLPILARDIPVFHEVAGECAYYFNGLAPEGLADAITVWLTLYQKSAYPRSEGIHCLTWQESAVQLKKQLGLDMAN